MAENCCRGVKNGLDGNPSAQDVLVEYLYLDNETCDRCISAEDALDGVMDVLSPALRMAGHRVAYRKTEVATAEMAAQLCFEASPTIRVNGRDVCGEAGESSCACCSEISGTDVTCRVFAWQGRTYEAPPAEMLAAAILIETFAPAAAENGKVYELPENLRKFFEGKSKKQAASRPKCG